MNRRQGYDSRTAWSTATSAAYDRAANADRLQTALEDTGWDVTRLVHSTGVTVVLERPGRPGQRFAGPTALDALQLAASWAIGEGSEGGEA